LATSDLAAAVDTETYKAPLCIWQRVMAPADIFPEGLRRMRAAYAKEVAMLPPAMVAAIIQAGGFTAPVQFFQVGLMHAWFANRPL